MGHNDVIYVVAAGSLIAAVFLIMCLSDLYSEMVEPGSGSRRGRCCPAVITPRLVLI